MRGSTSSSGSILRNAMTCIKGSRVDVVSDVRGKTTMALGSQEWFRRATVGEIEIPIGVSVGVVTENVFVMN